MLWGYFYFYFRLSRLFGMNFGTNFGLHLRRKSTETLTKSRIFRITALLVCWILIREISHRTNGFQTGPIVCPIRLLTGFTCPGCGGTRALGAISTGDFQSAWNLNPLTFVFVFATIIWATKFQTVTKLIGALKSKFQRQSRLVQLLFLVTLYLGAWVSSINRFNSGIF